MFSWPWNEILEALMATSWHWNDILGSLWTPSWPWKGTLDGLMAPSGPWNKVLEPLVASSGPWTAVLEPLKDFKALEFLTTRSSDGKFMDRKQNDETRLDFSPKYFGEHFSKKIYEKICVTLAC